MVIMGVQWFTLKNQNSLSMTKLSDETANSKNMQLIAGLTHICNRSFRNISKSMFIGIYKQGKRR